MSTLHIKGFHQYTCINEHANKSTLYVLASLQHEGDDERIWMIGWCVEDKWRG